MPSKPLRRLIAPTIVVVLLGTSSCSTSNPIRASVASIASTPAVATDAVTNIVKTLKDRSVPGGVLDSIRAVLVVVRGRNVVEFYNGGSATTSHNVKSVTKSVMSTLIGIALAEGRLKRQDQTLGALLPAHAHAMKSSTSAITLRQLLTMTSGLPDDSATINLDLQKSRDWVGDVLRIGTVDAPGTFAYSSVGSHLLSAILVQATGMSVVDHARAKLFDPLGIVMRPSVSLTYVLGSKEYERRYDQAGFT